MWAEWADWLGVPRLSFFAALGAVIERREHHRRVFDVFRPGFGIHRARAERAAQGRPDRSITPEDIYPDAVPCLLELKRRGYVVGIVGNQPVEAERVFRSLGVPADHVASSDGWGVEKPSVGYRAGGLAGGGQGALARGVAERAAGRPGPAVMLLRDSAEP